MRPILIALFLVAICIAIIAENPSVETKAAQTPAAREWHFVVSGDSRNCGDVVMPAIAEAASRHQASFYLHLGDFRAIYDFDQDMRLPDKHPMTILEYEGK